MDAAEHSDQDANQQPASNGADMAAAVLASPNVNGTALRPSAAPDSGVNKRYRPAPAKTFQCRGYGDCRMVFSRSEHLARHIRKHTGERPFSCHCGKQFSRLDNLRQHAQTVHADKQEQNERMMRDLTSLHASMVAASKAGSRSRRGAKKSAQQQDPDGEADDDRDADGDADMEDADPSLSHAHIKTEQIPHSLTRGPGGGVRPETSTGYEGMDFNANGFRGQDASFRGGSHSFRAFRESTRPFLTQANPFRPGQGNNPFEGTSFVNHQGRTIPFEASQVNFKGNNSSRFVGNSLAFEANPGNFATNNSVNFDPSRNQYTPSPPHGMPAADLAPHLGQQRAPGFSGPGPMDFPRGVDGQLPLGFLPSHLGQSHRQGSRRPSHGQQHQVGFSQGMDGHLRAVDGLQHQAMQGFSRQHPQTRAFQPYRDLRQRQGPSLRLSLQDDLQIGSQQTGFAPGTGNFSGEPHPGPQRLGERRSLHLRLSSPRSLGNLQAQRQGVASPFRQSGLSPGQQGAFTSPGHPGIPSHHSMGQASPHQGVYPSPGHQRSPFHPSSMGETALSHFPFPAFPDPAQDMRAPGQGPGSQDMRRVPPQRPPPSTSQDRDWAWEFSLPDSAAIPQDMRGTMKREDDSAPLPASTTPRHSPSTLQQTNASPSVQQVHLASAPLAAQMGPTTGQLPPTSGISPTSSQIPAPPAGGSPSWNSATTSQGPGLAAASGPGLDSATPSADPGPAGGSPQAASGASLQVATGDLPSDPTQAALGSVPSPSTTTNAAQSPPATSPPHSAVSPLTEASPETAVAVLSTSTSTAAGSPSTSTSRPGEDSRRRHSSANPVMSAYAQELIRQQQAQMQNAMSKLRDGDSSPTPASASSAPSPNSASGPVADLPVRASSSMASTRAATLSRPPARTRASRGRAASAGTADMWETANFPPLAGPLGMTPADNFYPGVPAERAARRQHLPQAPQWDELRPLTTEQQYPLPSPHIQQTFEWTQFPPDFPVQAPPAQAAAPYMPEQLGMMPFEPSYPPLLQQQQQPDGPLLPDPQFRQDGRAYGHLPPLLEGQSRSEENWMMDSYQAWSRGP